MAFRSADSMGIGTAPKASVFAIPSFVARGRRGLMAGASSPPPYVTEHPYNLASLTAQTTIKGPRVALIKL